MIRTLSLSCHVTYISKTPGSFLGLPVDMAISSAPVLTREKSQVSGRWWDRGVNDILSNYLSPLHMLLQRLEENTWDKQLHGKRFWSPWGWSTPLGGLCCRLVLKQCRLKHCGVNKCKHVNPERNPLEGLSSLKVRSRCINKILEENQYTFCRFTTWTSSTVKLIAQPNIDLRKKKSCPGLTMNTFSKTAWHAMPATREK